MKRIVLAAALLAAAIASAAAWDLEAASGRFGVIIVNNQYDPLPLVPVTNTLGGSVAISFSKGFFLSLQPALDLYWTNYKWYEDRAVPTESETGEGNNAFVLGFIVDLPLTASFRFGERIGGAFGLGPAFVLRASFKNDATAGVEDAMVANLAAIASYFWADGRWLYPSASLRFDVYLQQNFTFAFGVRGLMPIYNAWTGNEHLFDEGMLHVTMAMYVGLE